MRKRAIALLLAVVMLLCIGCGKKDSGGTEPVPTPENMEAPETQPQSETMPGTAKNEFDSDFDFDEPEETESPATEETGDRENEPEQTKPGENKPGSNKPGENKPEQTKPQETEPEETEPEEPTTESTGAAEEADRVTYEEYNNMTPEEQVAFFQSFGSVEEFMAWYNQAKEEYEKEHGSIEIEDGNIDLGDIVKPEE